MTRMDPLEAAVTQAIVPHMQQLGLGGEDSAYLVDKVIAAKYEGVIRAFTIAVSEARVEQKLPTTKLGRWLSSQWDLTPKLILRAVCSDGKPGYDFTTSPAIQIAAVKHLARQAKIDPETIFSLGRDSSGPINPKIDPYTVVAAFASASDAETLVKWAQGHKANHLMLQNFSI